MLRFSMAAMVAAAACWAGCASAALPDTPYHVGETLRQFHPDAARHWRGAQTQALVTTIWYPVDAGTPETPHDIGKPGRRTFKGHPFADKAPLSTARAKYPLLLLSHGKIGRAHV